MTTQATIGSTFNDWNRALDEADEAEQTLKAAMRANLFTTDPDSFAGLSARASATRKAADQKLDAAVAAFRFRT